MTRRIAIDPMDYRLVICAAYHEKKLTMGAALLRLFNAGFRGRFLDLNWNHEHG